MTHCSKSCLGPFIGRAVGKIGKSQPKWNVKDRGDVADPHIGVEQQHLGSRLLAQCDGHVDADSGLSNATLGREDADSMTLPGNGRAGECFI